MHVMLCSNCGLTGSCTCPGVNLLLLQFMWANYLRAKVPMVLMAVGDVESYVARGLTHATAPEASAMPGYAALESADEERLDLMANQGPPPAGAAG
jgi:hypothetical protein